MGSPYRESRGGICPRCGGPILVGPALSRRDNATLICGPCGTDEALLDSGTIAESARSPLMKSWPYRGLDQKVVGSGDGR